MIFFFENYGKILPYILVLPSELSIMQSLSVKWKRNPILSNQRIIASLLVPLYLKVVAFVNSKRLNLYIFIMEIY